MSLSGLLMAVMMMGVMKGLSYNLQTIPNTKTTNCQVTFVIPCHAPQQPSPTLASSRLSSLLFSLYLNANTNRILSYAPVFCAKALQQSKVYDGSASTFNLVAVQSMYLKLATSTT